MGGLESPPVLAELPHDRGCGRCGPHAFREAGHVFLLVRVAVHVHIGGAELVLEASHRGPCALQDIRRTRCLLPTSISCDEILFSGRRDSCTRCIPKNSRGMCDLLLFNGSEYCLHSRINHNILYPAYAHAPLDWSRVLPLRPCSITASSTSSGLGPVTPPLLFGSLWM